jgi:hypothetical protein
MGFVMNLTSFGELGEENGAKSVHRETRVFREIRFGARFYPMRPVVEEGELRDRIALLLLNPHESWYNI